MFVFCVMPVGGMFLCDWEVSLFPGFTYLENNLLNQLLAL